MLIKNLSLLIIFLVFSHANAKIHLNLICEIPDALKKDCGYSGITESECQNRNCCYVPSAVSGITWCYNPGTQAPSVSPTLSPSFSPSYSQNPTYQPSKVPTNFPTISLAPTTLRPSQSPTATPTTKAVDNSVKIGRLVVAMIIVGLLILFILLFLGLSYYRIRSQNKGSENEKAVPKKTTEEMKESSYVSLYPNDQSLKIYNRRDLYMTTFADESQVDEDEGRAPRPISWYEDRDHGFVN